MSKIISFAICGSAVVAGLVGLGARASGTEPNAQSWEPYIGPILPDFLLQPEGGEFRNIAGGDWNVAIARDLPRSVVVIDWTYRPIGEVVLHRELVFSYWLSAIAIDDDGLGFLVAGKRRNGNTVIDHYTFSTPPIPSGGVTGAWPMAVDNIYDSAIERRDMVSAMERLSGTGDSKAILQFHDSHDIWEIDQANLPASLSLLASADPALGATFLIPQLQERAHFDLDVYNHASAGYTYILQSAFPGDHSVVITDPGRSGSTLNIQALDTNGWSLSGFGNADNYIDWQ